MNIIRKVKGLLSKTEAAGCSEHEALAALQLAAALMEEHDLSMSQVEFEESEYIQHPQRFATGKINPTWHPVRGVFGDIARFCDCDYWMHSFDLVYFGLKSDTEIAHYLTEVLKRAMGTEYTKAKRTAKMFGQKLDKRSFMAGMAFRLGQRLSEIKKAREEKSTPQSKALVSMKAARTAGELEKLGLDIKTVGFNPKAYDPASTRFGVNAGGNVKIMDGVGKDKKPGELS